MSDIFKSVLSGIVLMIGWVFMLIVFGFVIRLNFEIFMLGWSLIK